MVEGAEACSYYMIRFIEAITFINILACRIFSVLLINCLITNIVYMSKITV